MEGADGAEKAIARFGSIGVNVTVTELKVPWVNAGIPTIALIGVPTTVKDYSPIPSLTIINRLEQQNFPY